MNSNYPNGALGALVTATADQDSVIYRPRTVADGEGQLHWSVIRPFPRWNDQYLEVLGEKLADGGHTVVIDHIRPPAVDFWAPLHDILTWSPEGADPLFPDLVKVAHMGVVETSPGVSGCHNGHAQWRGVWEKRTALFHLDELVDHAGIHRIARFEYGREMLTCPRWDLDLLVRYLANEWNIGSRERRYVLRMQAAALVRRLRPADPLSEPVAELFAGERPAPQVAEILAALR